MVPRLDLLFRPSFYRLVFRDLFRVKYPVHDNSVHLDETMNWLRRSQDVTGCHGSSAFYRLLMGWAGPYPETTGYLISTFLKHAKLTGLDDLRERAIMFGKWEMDIQLPSGAVRGGFGINEFPIVFNTGMVIFGWVDLFDETGEEVYREAAVKAADWLCEVQDSDGKWSRHTFLDKPHAYHSRVTWSILGVHRITGEQKYMDAAVKNIRWVHANMEGNGWVKHMSFYPTKDPLTHTICYTIRGMLECSEFIDGDLKAQTREWVISVSGILLDLYREHGHLPGRINTEWKSGAKFECVTGNAQMAIIWLKVYRWTGERKFYEGASDIITQVKETQDIHCKIDGVRGAISGSHPLWGSYLAYSYPNWGAKFFADALMLLDECKQE